MLENSKISKQKNKKTKKKQTQCWKTLKYFRKTDTIFENSEIFQNRQSV